MSKASVGCEKSFGGDMNVRDQWRMIPNLFRTKILTLMQFVTYLLH